MRRIAALAVACLSAAAIGGAAGREADRRDETPRPKGVCEVRSFEMTLEGWARDRDPQARRPCRLEVIDPQRTCRTPPCYNLACRAVVRYQATVRLSAESQGRLWPSCGFYQQRMGLRGHNEGGRRKLDQFEPRPAGDFWGSLEGRALGLVKRPAPGEADVYEVEFYDMPGWSETYWNGRPNATSPAYFPLDFRYMYRAYFGPPRLLLQDHEYRYIRVDMEARTSPQLEIRRDQRPQSAPDWQRWGQELLDIERSLPRPGRDD